MSIFSARKNRTTSGVQRYGLIFSNHTEKEKLLPKSMPYSNSKTPIAKVLRIAEKNQ